MKAREHRICRNPKCGKVFTPSVWNQKFCPECLADPETKRERARERKRRSVSGGGGEPDTVPAPYRTKCRTRKVCEKCGKPFRCTSNNQKVCWECRLKEGKRGRKERPGKKSGGERGKVTVKPAPPPLVWEKVDPAGHRFRPNSNAQKFCPECRAAERRRYMREYMRRYRGKGGD